MLPTITSSDNGKFLRVANGAWAAQAWDVIGEPGFEQQIANAAEAWLEEQDFSSPTVDVTSIEGGHRLTVTDYEGSESFDVMDGKSAVQNDFAGIGISGKFIGIGKTWISASTFGQSAPIAVTEGEFIFIYHAREIPASDSLVITFLNSNVLDGTTTSNIVKTLLVGSDLLRNGWCVVQVPNEVSYITVPVLLQYTDDVVINRTGVNGNFINENSVEKLKNQFNLFEDYLPGKFINQNGGWSTLAAYGQSKPIPVSEGEVVCVYGIYSGESTIYQDVFAFLSNDTLDPTSTSNIVSVGATTRTNPDRGYLDGWYFVVVPPNAKYFSCAVISSGVNNVIINKIGKVKSRVNHSLFGKKVSFYGDSITTYAGYIPSGNVTYYGTGGNGANILQTMKQTWWKKTIDFFGLSLLVNNSWTARVVSSIKDSDSSFGHNQSAGYKQTNISALGTGGVSPEIIIIKLGINDFGYNCPLGDYDGSTALPTTAATFTDAYAMMLDRIMTTFPLAAVYCCTLQACEWHSAILGFPEVNGNGDSIDDFNSAIRKLAAAFGAKVIDHESCGITYYNMPTYMGDYSTSAHTGLHPNADGMTLIADSTIAKLREDDK